MARVEEYRTYVQQVLQEYAAFKPSYGDIEVQTIFDQQHDHYELVNVGWHHLERIHGCVIHIDIKNGKIWIQHDGTEIGIANELSTWTKIFIHCLYTVTGYQCRTGL